jgi:putative DNA primase/helicase
VADFGQDLRHCWPSASWLAWRRCSWHEDDVGFVWAAAKRTIVRLHRWACKTAEADPENKQAQAVIKHALRSLDSRRLAAMIGLARSEAGIPIVPDQLDADPWLFNVANGTLDLRTGVLREHRRDDYITRVVPVDYVPTAACPLWLAFLHRVMNDRPTLVSYLQRVLGYCLTGLVTEQCMWLLHGCGQNGKSTFLGILLELFGEYGLQAVGDLLMMKAWESHPTERADLFRKRLVATIEVESGKRMAESLMKSLTGGDKVRARKMRMDFFTFTPTHKILLAANHKPVISGTDLAVWRRIKLIPFDVVIPEAQKDKHLPDKLRAELPGILAWAVRGCLQWQQEGMQEPDEVGAATAAYRREQDTISAFLRACCCRGGDKQVLATLLFEAYQEFSGDKLLGRKAFGDRLRAEGFVCRHRERGWFWQDLGLVTE